MKIKIFLTTYNSPDILHNSLKSIIESNINLNDVEITVINNHSNFKCNFSNVKILHNQVRLDRSTGHLARSWNQCIINGFKDIKNPDCDFLITMQDDFILKNNWFNVLYPHMTKYSFIEVGGGDIMCIYSQQAIADVGLWDERFCNIGYQEADYFLRQFLFNRSKISINDYAHNRVYNPIYNSPLRLREIDNDIIKVLPRDASRHNSHNNSCTFHRHSQTVFAKKWGNSGAINWDEHQLKNIKIIGESYVYYPYFEYGLNTQKLNADQNFNFI